MRYEEKERPLSRVGTEFEQLILKAMALKR